MGSDVLNIVFMKQIGKQSQYFRSDDDGGPRQFDLNAVIPAKADERWAKWGTPANAESALILHDDIICFRTRRHSPCEVFVELSKNFPDREIAVCVWDSEDEAPVVSKDADSGEIFKFIDGPMNFYRAGMRVLESREWNPDQDESADEDLMAGQEYRTLRKKLITACDAQVCRISHTGPQLSAVVDDGRGGKLLFANYNKGEDSGLVECLIMFDEPVITLQFSSKEYLWRPLMTSQSCVDPKLLSALCRDGEFVDRINDLARLPAMFEIRNRDEHDEGASVQRVYAMINGVTENSLETFVVGDDDEIAEIREEYGV